MAITLDDFNKIWASTSPLTPYSFTEDNYKSGWNFIGATPPSRQMWDFLQKQNDEKTQWLNDNKLSLSGGTMTGTINTSESQALKKTDSDNYIQINSGVETADGSNLVMCAKGYSGTLGAGSFQLTARDSNEYKSLYGKPDGTLTWAGKTVIVGTEATESTTISSIGGNATANFTLSHKARYYSVMMSGTGYAFMNVTMSTDQQTINVYNTTGTARSNIGLTVRYIY